MVANTKKYPSKDVAKLKSSFCGGLKELTVTTIRTSKN